MIECRELTKRYGRTSAVEALSFMAPKGEIVGLLGVNGAGKTTTLNLLTGYIPSTSGQVLVDGIDLQRDPRACKRRIGYLPERPPLYDEMTVSAYLSFVCRLREVQREAIPAHVREILGICGLEEVAQRRLGNLSKGYRQRVGIAQALCGDPPVLVLDEPTVGLDPRQVTEIRALIRTLGETHTVLFSSHLLSEVQQLCHRVLILHHGHLVWSGALGEIHGEEGILRLRVRVLGEEKRLLPALRSLPSVRRVQPVRSGEAGVTEARLECGLKGELPQKELFRLLCGLDCLPLSIIPERDSLEEAFLRITAET